MNGERVGEWTTLRTGTPVFRYEESWLRSEHVRALSLSLPLTADREVRGPAVENYFDNLLPDSPEMRRRIRTRFKTPSASPFDLLTAIGRDCVGAVQLLPADAEPQGWNRIDATPLTEREVERTLYEVTLATPLGRTEQDEFRISLAGAEGPEHRAAGALDSYALARRIGAGSVGACREAAAARLSATGVRDDKGQRASPG